MLGARWGAVAGAATVACAAAVCEAGPVGLSDGLVEGYAVGPGGFASMPMLTPAAVPFAGSTGAQVTGASILTTAALSLAEFSVSHEMAVVGGYVESIGSFRFTAESEVAFDARAGIEWGGSDSDLFAMSLFASLIDMTDGTVLFRADLFNEPASSSAQMSLTGVLQAGHQYEWNYFTYMFGGPTDGRSTVSLGFGTPVPLPGASGLAMAGVGLIAAARRRSDR